MSRLLLAALLLVPALAAQAQTGAPQAATPVRPRGGPSSESSLPSAAPPASTTQTTGSTDQNPVVKGMNDAEKSKVEAKGK
jgi:hypothetical protein